MNEGTYLQIITGNSTGGLLITGTTAVTGSWDGLVVNESCVIDTIKINGVDVTTTRNYDSNTLVAGMFIGAGFNYTGQAKWKIDYIKLTSGSLMAY